MARRTSCRLLSQLRWDCVVMATRSALGKWGLKSTTKWAVFHYYCQTYVEKGKHIKRQTEVNPQEEDAHYHWRTNDSLIARKQNEHWFVAVPRGLDNETKTICRQWKHRFKQMALCRIFMETQSILLEAPEAAESHLKNKNQLNPFWAHCEMQKLKCCKAFALHQTLC